MTAKGKRRTVPKRLDAIPTLPPGFTGPRQVVAHALSLVPKGMPLSEWLTSVIPEGTWTDMSDDDLAACILGHAAVVASDGWTE